VRKFDVPLASVRAKYSSNPPVSKFAVGVIPESSCMGFARSYKKLVEVLEITLVARRPEGSYTKLPVLPASIVERWFLASQA
jgi:hypothetical protein